MGRLSTLEDAVLREIASQYPEGSEVSELLSAQRSTASVTQRRNTGAGFYTTLEIDPSCKRLSATSPMGNVFMQVHGLQHGMGCILWLEDGRVRLLEGFSFDECTTAIDLASVKFEIVPNAATIHIYASGEGVDCWRPVKAAHLGDDRYRILGVPSENEVWEFARGEVVRCEPRVLSGDGGRVGHHLIAVRRAEK